MSETIAWILVFTLGPLLGLLLVDRGRRHGPVQPADSATRPPAADAILAALPVSVSVADAAATDLPLVFVNDRFVELTGTPVSQAVGRNARFLQGSDRDQAARADIRTALAEGRSHQTRLRNYREDGSPFWTALHLAPLRDATGRPSHFVGVHLDITEQVETEQRLRDRQQQQFALAAIAQRSVEVDDLAILFEETLAMLGRVLAVKLAGVIEHESATDTFRLCAGIGWQPGIVGRSTTRPSRESPEVLAFASRQTVVVHDIEQDERFGPQPVYDRHGIRSSLSSVIWAGGEPWGLLGALAEEPNRFRTSHIEFVQATAVLLGHAIARHQQTRQMEADRGLLDAIVSSSADAIVTLDRRGTITSANPAVQRMFGYPPHALLGQPIERLLPADGSLGHPDPPQARPDFRDPGPGGATVELEARHQLGHSVPVEVSLTRAQVGDERLGVLTLRDLTQRQAMQQQLFHAQKMEAIGQLTGGVAHDFNNLLTVILSNLGTLLEQSMDEEARQLIDETVSAAARGSTLTHRLLAFSRQQPLAPRRIDVNELVAGLQRLLARTFGESHQVNFEPAPDLWPCNVDPGHLEAALLNLAVNARDAMPRGGRLTIRTANGVLDAEDCREDDELQPGSYVSITVADTGTGMSPEVMANAFEPYFTTKPFGQGSGLGLSMVFGFVKQSGGHVRLRSELEAGTEVTLFLPRAWIAVTSHGDSESERSEPEAAAVDHAPVRILMVEDDPLVGGSTRRMLEHEGYAVSLVTDGPKALALIDTAERFDLLFTDMVMPGEMNGRDLTAAIHERQPDMPVLITSGYADTDLFGDPTTRSGFLQKPYSRAALVNAIRKALADAR